MWRATEGMVIALIPWLCPRHIACCVLGERALGTPCEKGRQHPLIMHGDDDQIVPIGASALLSSKLVKGSTLKIYPGLPHGMCSTHKDQINADLLAFAKAS